MIVYNDRNNANILDFPGPIVNPINVLGVSGAGLAFQVARRWIDVSKTVHTAGIKGKISIGSVLSVIVDEPTEWVLCVPTKRHWQDLSRFADVVAGIEALRVEADRLGLETLAVPQLGCGLGGLRWDQVRPEIERVFAGWPGRLVVYGEKAQ